MSINTKIYKNQTTIPAPYRKKYNITSDCTVTWEDKGNGEFNVKINRIPGLKSLKGKYSMGKDKQELYK